MRTEPEGRSRRDTEWQRTKDKKFTISGLGCVAPEASEGAADPGRGLRGTDASAAAEHCVTKEATPHSGLPGASVFQAL